MIDVDSNILAYLLIDGVFCKRAEALLASDSNWIAPLLWKSEFRKILAGYIRRKDFSFDKAYQIIREAEFILSSKEFEVDSLQVLELNRDSNCSAYDCELVGLAIKNNCKLVTMNKQILKAFPQTAVPLRGYQQFCGQGIT
jgi:predicted nucleic acid-binding protein